MVPIIVLLVLLLIATVTDVVDKKIYNWNMYPGMVIGLALNGFGLGHHQAEAGWNGVFASVIGFSVCGFILLVCFVFFDIGGGDVKLIAMMGAFLGYESGIEAMLWTFVLGCVLACSVLIWKIGILRILTKTFEHLRIVWRAKTWVSLTKDEHAPLKAGLFLAPCAFVAVCIVSQDYLMRLAGF